MINYMEMIFLTRLICVLHDGTSLIKFKWHSGMIRKHVCTTQMVQQHISFSCSQYSTTNAGVFLHRLNELQRYSSNIKYFLKPTVAGSNIIPCHKTNIHTSCNQCGTGLLLHELITFSKTEYCPFTFSACLYLTWFISLHHNAVPIRFQMTSNGGSDKEQIVTEEELQGENLENFNILQQYGIDKTVARELIKVYETGMTMNEV